MIPINRLCIVPKSLLLSKSSHKGKTKDQEICEWYVRTGGTKPNIVEALSQRIHDYSIEENLLAFISGP